MHRLGGVVGCLILVLEKCLDEEESRLSLGQLYRSQPKCKPTVFMIILLRRLMSHRKLVRASCLSLLNYRIRVARYLQTTFVL